MKARIELLSLALLVAACKGEDRLAPSAPPRVPVSAVSVVQPASNMLPVGGTLSLTARVVDERGAVVTDRVVIWTSSDSTQASIFPADAMGGTAIVTGIGPGSAIITATSEGKNGTMPLTILGPPVALTLSPAAVQLAKGGSFGLTAVVQDAAGNVLAPISLAYATSDTAIAMVDSLGVVSAVGLGTAMITATIVPASQGGLVTQQRNFISQNRGVLSPRPGLPVYHDDLPAQQPISGTAMVTVLDSQGAGARRTANLARGR